MRGCQVTESDSSEPGITGLIGAMASEVYGLVDAMEVASEGRSAGFDYWRGTLAGREVVLARCGMGKVAAASGVQRLIDEWRAGSIVLCGLAGGLDPRLKLGDIVVGESFVQHDIDASPIFPRFQVPSLGISLFHAEPGMVQAAEAASREAAAILHRDSAPRIYRGLIATGDQFIKDEKREEIRAFFPDALCVEMEGGAIAQVCSLNQTPYAVVRIVSDGADEAAPDVFRRFVEEMAPLYTVSIVRALLPKLP